ncbi:unnamed protein product, partial [Pylaiella littoralis]
DLRHVVRLRGGVRRLVRLSEAQRDRRRGGQPLGLVHGSGLHVHRAGVYLRHVRRSGAERPGERRQRWQRNRYRERRRLFFLRNGPCGRVLLRRLSPARGQRVPHKRGCSGTVHPGGVSRHRHLLHHRARGRDMHVLRPAPGPGPCSCAG